VNLLDRHIFKSILTTCAAAVCLFAFVLMAGNILRELLGPLLAGQLRFVTFGRLVLLLLPVVMSYALPLGTLTGVLLTFGRLSSDSEITAMRAAGLGVPRIAMPVFAMAVLGVAVGLAVNFESMPWAKVQYEKELVSAMRANPLSFIVPEEVHPGIPGLRHLCGVDEGIGPSRHLALAARRKAPGDPVHSCGVGPGRLRRGGERADRHPGQGARRGA
jgi:lipopolysaccharide export system permease protein